MIDGAITDLWNDKVVKVMNSVISNLPKGVMRDDNMRANLSNFIELHKQNQEMKTVIKNSIAETSKGYVNVKQQQHLADRLKREIKYGINGEASVSTTSISDIAKLNNTVEDFISKSSEYEDEDKELLKQIFTDGN